MIHDLYLIGWANDGVGNFAAGIIAGLLTTVVVKKWRLHEKARTWLHAPLHARLDAHEERLAELRKRLEGKSS